MYILETSSGFLNALSANWNGKPASLDVQSGISVIGAMDVISITGFLATTALIADGNWPARCVTKKPP